MLLGCCGWLTRRPLQVVALTDLGQKTACFRGGSERVGGRRLADRKAKNWDEADDAARNLKSSKRWFG